MTHSLQLGQIVELKDGRQAAIRFLGRTRFASGDWVGVELEDASGKNDGSVQGDRYFDCDVGHGMFLRDAVITRVLEQPQPKAATKSNGKANGQPAQPRPSSGTVNGLKRQSIVDANSKRQSFGIASPTPGARGIGTPSGLRSPTKSPTKSGASTTSSGQVSRTTTPPISGRSRPSTITSKSRPSMAPPGSKRTSTGAPAATTTSRTTRPSVGGIASSSSRTGRTPASSQERASAGRSSLAPQRGPPQQSSPTKENVSDAEGSGAIGQALSPGEDQISPLQSPLSEGQPEESSIEQHLRPTAPTNGQAKSTRPSAGRRPSSPQPSVRPSRTGTASNRQIEELEAKLKVMERKRMEDREKLKALDRIQQERDRFESIIQKLQTKYQPQQQEIADLRKRAKESAEKIDQLEGVQAEHDSVMEMATLDKEMAEETAEGYKAELQSLRANMEELQLEVEVLREENQELGQEMSPEEKTSQGWLQMERTNERLREALLRLRDLTQEREDEMKGQIQGLEADVKDLTEVQEEYEIAKEKLLQSEADAEDLRQQLEAALGAEEMIEELSERNQVLTERVEELNAQVEDLESLKEINDELEVNHVGAEKQLQEEIDFKEALIFEQNRKAAQQDERLQDYEYTLLRFRELVSSQQSAIDDMTAARQVTETEAADLNERSRAMMDLNMKLQISASKTQVKTIDLELRRLDAQEATEHLGIVQLFLPEAFQTERDSVLALLRFKRIGFKAQLIHGFVREKLSGQVQTGHEDDLFAACDVLDKLTWLTAMCERFTNTISTCSVERFAKFEGALYELEPIERALNSYIEGLKKGDLKEQKVADELQRSMAVMEHLAEIHLQPSLESYADNVLMRTLMIQSHLENTAAALSQTKAMVQAKVQLNDDTSEEDRNELEFFANKADTLISASRSAKVIIGKALRSLEELKSRSLALNEDTESDFEASEEFTKLIAAYSRAIGISLHSLLSEEGRAQPFTPHEIKQNIASATSSFLSHPEPEPSLLSTLTFHLLTATEAISGLAATASDLTLTKEFERGPAPWVLRASSLKNAKLTTLDTEELLARSRDDNAAKARELRLKEQALDEQAVKIELLEARMKDAGRRSAKIGDLEKEIEVTKGRELELAAALRKRDEEIRRAVEERDEWRRVAGERKATVATTGELHGGAGAHAVATAREMDALRQRIRGLEAAVRWLRDDNRRARLVEPALQRRAGTPAMDWLAKPLLPTTKTSDQRRREAIASEGKDVLRGLLELVDRATPVDLSTLPEDKLAWRPAREKSRFRVLKQAEDFESWATWRNEVAKKARGLQRMEEHRNQARQAGKVAARVNFLLPALPGEKVQDREVQIVEPGEFEELRDAIGVA